MSNYYLWASYHRKILDILQEKYKKYYKGVVLDIGGRDRGRFKKPKGKVNKWIFADINKDYKPDIILDVANMDQIKSYSIDVVNAIELFEHVKEINLGLKECHRVLKKNGVLIMSVPFLSSFHGDPYDYQRWTYIKWRMELSKIGFKIEKFVVMGKYFTHLSEILKTGLISYHRSGKRWGSILLKILHPLLDRIILYDTKSFVKNNKILNNYHNGYFLIARKETVKK